MTSTLPLHLLLLLSLLSLIPLITPSPLIPRDAHRHRSSPPLRAIATVYNVSDAALGPRFDGVGAISGGGSTSRLLPSYPPAVLSEILDYLFKPNFGAAFHWLKVEIGGEGLSSEGAEASHARTLEELQSQPNYRRGYEWQLMVEAKKRNPNVLLYGLPWAWPGYLGTTNPWLNVTVTANYTLSWVTGAMSEYGLSIDVLGVWNERSYSAPYIKLLRRMLDESGFPNTKLLCDDSHYACATEMMTDPVLNASVAYLGGHDPSTPAAKAPGKPVWFSEDFHSQGGEPGGAVWANQINTRYIEYGMTATLAWNAVDAFYRGLTFDDTGLMNARCPWSGNYEVLATVWATAHTTQFTQPGWRYLPVNAGSGTLQAGGSYVTYVNHSGGAAGRDDFTVVVEKFARDGRGVAAETAQFCLSGSGGGMQWARGRSLAVWQSTFNQGGTVQPTYFNVLAPTTVDNSTGCFEVQLPLDSLTTITTLQTGGKGEHPTPPTCGPFPLPYTDTFDHCTPPQEADYFHTVSGAWECVQGPAPHNTFMRHQTTHRPVSWEASADTSPVGVLGEEHWTDLNVTLDARLNAANDSLMFAVRANLGNSTGYNTLVAEYTWAGLWLAIETTGQFIVQDHANHAKVIQQGKLPVVPAAGEWHTYSLVVRGNQLTGFQDGKAIFAAIDVSEYWPYGWMGYGTLAWGHHPDIDNLSVQRA